MEDLANYSVGAIEYAFDCHARNATKLPTLADILPILQSEKIPDSKTLPPGCLKCNQGWIVVNQEAKVSDYKMRRCECLTDESLREEKKSPPLTLQERAEIQDRWTKISGVSPKRFPNGMPRANIALTQARVLAGVK